MLPPTSLSEFIDFSEKTVPLGKHNPGTTSFLYSDNEDDGDDDASQDDEDDDAVKVARANQNHKTPLKVAREFKRNRYNVQLSQN